MLTTLDWVGVVFQAILLFFFVVLLIGWKKIPSRHNVVLRGLKWRPRETSPVFSGSRWKSSWRLLFEEKLSELHCFLSGLHCVFPFMCSLVVFHLLAYSCTIKMYCILGADKMRGKFHLYNPQMHYDFFKFKEEGHSRKCIFFVLTNKKTTLSWVTDRCLSFHSASDPNKIPLQRSKKFVIGRRHFGQSLGAWPRIRDVIPSKLKLARSSNGAGQFQVHSFSAALISFSRCRCELKRELMQRQRQGKRHFKNDFQIFQTCSR